MYVWPNCLQMEVPSTLVTLPTGLPELAYCELSTWLIVHMASESERAPLVPINYAVTFQEVVAGRGKLLSPSLTLLSSFSDFFFLKMHDSATSLYD